MSESLHSPPSRFSNNGIEIVYDTFGNPNSPPVLLIARLGAQMISWRDEFCTRLADRGFWVIRFDNRDAGLSTRVEGNSSYGLSRLGFAYLFNNTIRAPYTLLDMAHDAVKLLDHLGVSSAHLVGASLGGMIAQMAAIHFPGKVRTLTSFMSTTGHPWLPLPRPRSLVVLQPVQAGLNHLVDHSLKVKRALHGPRYPIDEEEVRAHALRLYERCSEPSGTARQLAAIAASGSRDHALRGLKVPTLVIHGSADPLLPVGHALHTHRTIPGSKLLVIQGMGHEFPRDAWPTVISALGYHATQMGQDSGLI